jgi:alpha-1,2-mannosyltransferase
MVQPRLGAAVFRGRPPTRRCIISCCAILLAAEIAIFLVIVAGTYGLIVPLSRPTTTDFVSFFAAGKLADAGAPQLAYDRQAHYAAEQQAAKQGVPYNFFYYPPIFLIICAALARLPYLLAFVVFEAATLALYLLVAKHIVGNKGGADLVPVLAFPPVFWTIGMGQNAFLTAALFGAATLFIDRRPAVAGMLFGGLCYKPHFALLVPVALIAGRHWRAFAATFASAALLSSVSLFLFGRPTWDAFLIAAAASPGVYESGRIALGGFVTPFGAVLLLGGGPAVAYAVQAIAAISAAVLVAVVWHRADALPIRASVLAAATLVAVPLAIVYDLMLASIAGLWLIRGGEIRLRGWGGWMLAGLSALSLNPRALAEHWHLPVGAAISLVLFVAVAGIALRDGIRSFPKVKFRRGSGSKESAPILPAQSSCIAAPLYQEPHAGG